MLVKQFIEAAKNGNLEELDRIYNSVDDEGKKAMIDEDNYDAFCWAARNGHIGVLEWFKSNVLEDKFCKQ